MQVGRLRQELVFGPLAFLAPLLSLFLPLSMATIVPGAACALLVLLVIRREPWPLPRAEIAAILAGALLWAALSFAWSINPSGANAGKLLAVALLVTLGAILVKSGAAMNERSRRKVELQLLAGFAASLAIILSILLLDAAVDFVSSGAAATWDMTSHVSLRAATVLAILIWPVILVAWRRWPRVALGIWSTTMAASLLLESSAAAAALAGGTLAAIAAWFGPRLTRLGLALLFSGVVMAAPFAARLIPVDGAATVLSHGLSGSAQHRLLIWRFTAERIADRPYLGWGFETSREIPGGQEKVFNNAPVLPLHPHNASLQIWLEFGAVGAALTACLVGSMVLAFPAAIRREVLATGLGLMTTAFVVCNLSYSIWQRWWLASLLLSSALFAAVSHCAPSAKRDLSLESGQRHGKLPYKT
jgi:O-antigen ligase